LPCCYHEAVCRREDTHGVGYALFSLMWSGADVTGSPARAINRRRQRREAQVCDKRHWVGVATRKHRRPNPGNLPLSLTRGIGGTSSNYEQFPPTSLCYVRRRPVKLYTAGKWSSDCSPSRMVP